MLLEEIQPDLLTHFEKLVAADRLSHAYLFVGGFGNHEMAVCLTKAIFCPNTKNGMPDGTCRVCQLIDANEFADLHTIQPDGQSIKVEQIRELLSVFATTGFESEKKVVIIEEADKMGAAAANSLLKSIEEPASETFIFLLTENENRLLPTIRSRVQAVNFPKNENYLARMLENEGLEKSQSLRIAALTDSLTEARQLAAEDWFREGSQLLSEFVTLADRDSEAAFLMIPALTDIFTEKKQQETALSLLLYLLNQSGFLELTQKAFVAMRYFQANVRFQLALESVVL